MLFCSLKGIYHLVLPTGNKRCHNVIKHCKRVKSFPACPILTAAGGKTSACAWKKSGEPQGWAPHTPSRSHEVPGLLLGCSLCGFRSRAHPSGASTAARAIAAKGHVGVPGKRGWIWLLRSRKLSLSIKTSHFSFVSMQLKHPEVPGAIGTNITLAEPYQTRQQLDESDHWDQWPHRQSQPNHEHRDPRKGDRKRQGKHQTDAWRAKKKAPWAIKKKKKT